MKDTNKKQQLLGGPKSLFAFFYNMALVALVVFNFIQNNFVRLYCDSYYMSVHLNKAYHKW